MAKKKGAFIKKLNSKKNNLVKILNFPKLIINFLYSVKRELKEVEWLSKRQTIVWSTTVILTAISISIIIAIADLIFFKLREIIFNI